MGGARVWDVGAICSCADGAAEVLAEVSVVLTDPSDRLADSAGHCDSGTLGQRIARELHVSMNTLRTHTKSIYTKLGATSRREALRRAGEYGF